MKKYELKKIIAAAVAVCAAVSMLAACGKNNNTDSSTESSTSAEASSETTAADADASTDTSETVTLRVLEEGDVFAINKFVVDELPEGYELAGKSQQDGAQFLRYIIDGGKAQVSIEAANFRENYHELEQFADTACAAMTMNNMYYHCDTDFSEPEKTAVAGFDAIKYDYTITQNDFETDAEGNTIKDEDGKEIKTPVFWYKGRAYFFFSDNDVYYVIFETTKDNWDNSIDTFEQFLTGVHIDENAVNDPAEAPATEAVEEAVSDTSDTSAE